MECPKCKHVIIGYPSLSRKDNKTHICASCGTFEAMEQYLKYIVTKGGDVNANR